MKTASIVLLLSVITTSQAAVDPRTSTGTPAPSRVDRLQVSFSPVTPSAASTAPAGAADSAATPALVLPRFDVQEAPLKLTERDVTTAQELIEQAKRRYLTPVYQKTFGPLSAAVGLLANLPSILNGWHPNDAEASVLFAQDERLRRIRETDELLELIAEDDPATYRELKRGVEQSFRFDPPPKLRRGE